jgi:hypothetical protein
MHAGLNSVALIGSENRDAGWAGENLSGGDFANGIPRNWFTGPSAAGRDVVFPMMVPALIVAVGESWLSDRTKFAEPLKSSILYKDFVRILIEAQSIMLRVRGSSSFYGRI